LQLSPWDIFSDEEKFDERVKNRRSRSGDAAGGDIHGAEVRPEAGGRVADQKPGRVRAPRQEGQEEVKYAPSAPAVIERRCYCCDAIVLISQVEYEALKYDVRFFCTKHLARKGEEK
jgi:hypothetical protein